MDALRKATFGLLILMVMVILGYFLLPLVIGEDKTPESQVLSSSVSQNSAEVAGPTAASAVAAGSQPATSGNVGTVTAVTTVDNRAQRRVASAPAATAAGALTTVTTVRAIGQATTSTATRYLVTTSVAPATSVREQAVTTVPVTVAPEATPAPTVPRVEPQPVTRVQARLAEVLVQETFPILVDVRIVGELPSPCHRLAWNGPRFLPESKISLDITAEGAERRDCGNENLEFSRIISIGELDRGSYILELNGSPFAFTI